jgi:hypothetical protein
MDRYVKAIQQTESATDLDEFVTLARWSATEVGLVADSMEAGEWPEEYVSAKPTLVTGMRMVSDGYAEMAAGAEAGDEPRMRRGEDLVDDGHFNYVMQAAEFLYDN